MFPIKPMFVLFLLSVREVKPNFRRIPSVGVLNAVPVISRAILFCVLSSLVQLIIAMCPS